MSTPGSKVQPLTVPVLPPIRSTAKAFQCDFDFDMCGMTQDNLDDLDYIHEQGSTPSRGTGPTRDHTSGNGKQHTAHLQNHRALAKSSCLYTLHFRYFEDLN